MLSQQSWTLHLSNAHCCGVSTTHNPPGVCSGHKRWEFHTHTRHNASESKTNDVFLQSGMSDVRLCRQIIEYTCIRLCVNVLSNISTQLLTVTLNIWHKSTCTHTHTHCSELLCKSNSQASTTSPYASFKRDANLICLHQRCPNLSNKNPGSSSHPPPF